MAGGRSLSGIPTPRKRGYNDIRSSRYMKPGSRDVYALRYLTAALGSIKLAKSIAAMHAHYFSTRVWMAALAKLQKQRKLHA